jgi:hypothetical protein
MTCCTCFGCGLLLADDSKGEIAAALTIKRALIEEGPCIDSSGQQLACMPCEQRTAPLLSSAGEK